MMRLHHVNICTNDVVGLASFYESAFGFAVLKDFNKGLIRDTYNGGVVVFDAGDAENLQLHIAQTDHSLGFKSKQAVNPVSRGHYAFRTDDIDAVKRRLEKHGIQYSDFSTWAVKGWDQIFFYDPTGTVVEVHQVRSEARK